MHKLNVYYVFSGVQAQRLHEIDQVPGSSCLPNFGDTPMNVELSSNPVNPLGNEFLY